jgi:type I restriction enzyme, S subunit
MTRENTTAGKSEPTMVPNLRFPKFRNSPGWRKRPLSYLLSEPKRRNRDLKFSANEVLSVSGEFGCVNQIALLGRSYAGASVENYHVVETADIVYTKSPLKRNPYGIIKANKGVAGIVSTLYAVYRPTANADAVYLDYYFSRDYHLNSYLQPIVRKGPKNDMKVNNSDVLTGDVWVPEIEEQKKIADCLSTLDELIGAESQKLAALKAHKKGLMQQLFPREGETLPRLRFPEFQSAGDWRTLPLSALADKIMVGIASAATHAYRDTGVPMLRNQNIKEGKIDDSKLLFIDPVYEASHKNKRLRAGDVITVRTGYPGLSAVVPERYHNAQCFTSLITRPKRTVLNSDYLCALINSDIGKRFILGAEAGGAQKNVNAGALEALPVCLPKLEEQQRIADSLTSLDGLIAAQSDKLETLQTHKHGLIQQLFPPHRAI